MKPQNEPISEVLFGSCIKEDQPMPILNTILEHRPRPGVFLFLGDNIYADTTDPAIMRKKYDRLAANPGFDELTRTFPVMATWDDHDFGVNDGGAEYPLRDESEEIFLDFWKDAPDSPRRHRPGIYQANIVGPVGKRLQIILLDTRFFRGSLQTGVRRVGGPYVPADDSSIALLGESQWEWLENQLRQPAELRLLVSSIQLVADDDGQECWANLPHERDRFFRLLHQTRANGVVILSGDRHWSELSVETQRAPYPIYDLTSSSLNQPHGRGTPTTNRRRAFPTTYHRENYGRIGIQWENPEPGLELEIIDIAGHSQLSHTVALKDLQ